MSPMPRIKRRRYDGAAGFEWVSERSSRSESGDRGVWWERSLAKRLSLHTPRHPSASAARPARRLGKPAFDSVGGVSSSADVLAGRPGCSHCVGCRPTRHHQPCRDGGPARGCLYRRGRHIRPPPPLASLHRRRSNRREPGAHRRWFILHQSARPPRTVEPFYIWVGFASPLWFPRRRAVLYALLAVVASGVVILVAHPAQAVAGWLITMATLVVAFCITSFLTDALVKREKLAVVGEMASAIGHELRNPLGAVMNAVFLLRLGLQDGISHEQELQLQVAEREISKADAILNELGAYVRPGRPVVSFVHLEALVAEVLEVAPPPSDVRVTVVIVPVDFWQIAVNWLRSSPTWLPTPMTRSARRAQFGSPPRSGVAPSSSWSRMTGPASTEPMRSESSSPFTRANPAEQVWVLQLFDAWSRGTGDRYVSILRARGGRASW